MIILRRRTALTKIGIHSFNVHINTEFEIKSVILWIRFINVPKRQLSLCDCVTLSVVSPLIRISLTLHRAHCNSTLAQLLLYDSNSIVNRSMNVSPDGGTLPEYNISSSWWRRISDFLPVVNINLSANIFCPATETN